MKGQDALTGLPLAMRPEQNCVNDGTMFGFSYYNGDFDISAPITFLYKVGTRSICVNRVLQTIGGSAKIEVYKAPTTSANGTEVVTYNKNTSSQKTALTKIYVGPTVTADGAKCFEDSYVLGASNVPSKGQSSSSDSVWRKLAASTSYLVRVTAINDNLIMNYCGDFTEA